MNEFIDATFTRAEYDALMEYLRDRAHAPINHDSSSTGLADHDLQDAIRSLEAAGRHRRAA